MDTPFISNVLRADWYWWLVGALTGLWLVPLARIIPRKVLQQAQANLHEWQGPGGGLEQPAPFARRIWVPVVNAALWAFAANAGSHPAFLAASLLWCGVASMLLLLALMDWDTTLLPDWIVWPLGVMGLFSSALGFTSQSLLASAASAVVVLVFFGGFAWLFRRIKGMSGIGGGDLKLLAVLATWFGVSGVFHVMILGGVITVVWYLAWRQLKGFCSEAGWPFGPAIVIAALVLGM